jgi:putative CocE/NonD family hydrolase
MTPARPRTAPWLVAVLLLAAAVPALTGVPAAAQDDQPGDRMEGRICEEVLVEAADGVRLHTWVSRLEPDQPRPVLLEMESYARPENGCPTFLPGDYFPHILSPELIDRFTLVHVSYRGAGSSEGLFELTGPTVQQDLRDVIAWAREQAWSTGDVVLTGQSGTGFAQHHGLREAGVKAAVLYTSCADMYRCFHRGGIDNGLIGVYMGVTEAGWLSARQDAQRLGTDTNPPAPQQQAALAQATADARTGGTYDERWADRSSLDALAEVDVPVLLTSDPYDIVQPFDALQTIPGARLSFGMGHTTPDAANAEGSRYHELVRVQADRFVAHHVFGEDDGAEEDPAVTILTGTGSMATWRAGQSHVRTEAAWPLPNTRWTRLWLDPTTSGTASSSNDGTLAPAPPAADAASPAVALSTPAVRADLRTLGWALGGSAQTDMADDERSGLTWTTEAFEQNVEVTGPITLRLVATATTPDLDWVVRLTDVWPDGRSEWITDGYLRASLRHVDEDRSLRNADGEIVRPWLTFDAPADVPVGEPVTYLIEIIPTSTVFAAGHRIRLDVLPASQSGPDANPIGAGSVQVHTGPEGSSVLLPVIDGRCQHSVPLLEGMDPLDPCQSPWTPTPDAGQEVVVERVAGPDRAATAAAVADTAFGDGARVVHIATGEAFADALAGGPASHAVGGPVLLVGRDAVPAATRQALDGLDPEEIVVLGGPAAVGEAVMAELEGIAPTRRLAGADRYATAAAVAADAFPGGADVVHIATGADFPDALGGGAAAAALDGPVLLTQPESLPQATRDALQALAPQRIVVLGGPAAISDEVVASLGEIAPTARVAGPTRYATAAALVGEAFPDAVDTVLLATGEDFPDALAGAAAAGALGAPVLLVRPDDLPQDSADQLRRLSPSRVLVLGGTAAVDDTVMDAVRAAVEERHDQR